MNAMMKDPYKDYAPETRSLLAALAAAGWEVRRIDNGDGDAVITPKKGEPLSEQDFQEIMGCDDCRIAVAHDDFRNEKGNRRLFWVYLVFGNDPGELVNDYHVNPSLEAVLDAESNKWLGKPQPMAERA